MQHGPGSGVADVGDSAPDRRATDGGDRHGRHGREHDRGRSSDRYHVRHCQRRRRDHGRERADCVGQGNGRGVGPDYAGQPARERQRGGERAGDLQHGGGGRHPVPGEQPGHGGQQHGDELRGDGGRYGADGVDGGVRQRAVARVSVCPGQRNPSGRGGHGGVEHRHGGGHERFGDGDVHGGDGDAGGGRQATGGGHGYCGLHGVDRERNGPDGGVERGVPGDDRHGQELSADRGTEHGVFLESVAGQHRGVQPVERGEQRGRDGRRRRRDYGAGGVSGSLAGRQTAVVAFAGAGNGDVDAGDGEHGSGRGGAPDDGAGQCGQRDLVRRRGGCVSAGGGRPASRHEPAAKRVGPDCVAVPGRGEP